MFAPSISYKRYNSVKRRLLIGSLDQFFSTELPATFGPLLRQRIVEEIVERIEKILPRKDYLKPGQMVWNAVSTKTKPNDPNCRLVPIILTLIDEEDIEQLRSGTKMSTIAQNAVARITREAEKQGAYLSMRDIGLFCWRQDSALSTIRKKWEAKHNELLPFVGNKMDFGSCLTHKEMIIRKVVFEKKDPKHVAKETKHSQRCVDRYLRDYHRVKTCAKKNNDILFIKAATGLSKNLILQYLKLLHEENNKS